MNRMLKGLSSAALLLSTSITIASPPYLITHNYTNDQSNAYVIGLFPSSVPTEAHNPQGKVYWALVRMLCNGRLDSQRRCSALIKMRTNTPSPVDIGWVRMDIETGDIEPKQISGNGYTLTVNGPGEATITGSYVPQ